MFFHPNDQEGITRERVLRLYQSNKDRTAYSITIKNSTLFKLTVDHIATGLSFRQKELIIWNTKTHLCISSIGTINDTQVTDYARVVCAVNLEAIALLVNNTSVWAFSIASDAATHQRRSYFDNRLRIYFHGVLHKGILCPVWRAKIIGVESDGTNSMTGHWGGVATLFQ